MEKEVIKKLERFVQLSKKFTRTEVEIFGEKSSEAQKWVLAGSASSVGNMGIQEMKTKTRAEKIREEAEIRAIMAEEFEEYIKLQKDLEEYFIVINKFN